MQINKVAFIGKGGVGLLYGSMIAKALGNDAVEYVMDDTRFERHANDALTVNGKPCDLTSVRASEATPADLVILTVKTTGLDQALKTMERVVGPNTLIASLCNGITSEQKIAEHFGWEHTVLGICQGMDAVFLNGELTFTNAGEIRFVDGLPQTSKENKEYHGFGTRSIKTLTEKYGGDLKISAENGIFRLSIMLPIPT